jgi:uncharacterized protein YgiM (DUF1202 family)
MPDRLENSARCDAVIRDFVAACGTLQRNSLHFPMHRSRFLAVLTLLTLLCADIPLASATPVQDNTAGSWTDTFNATSGSLSTSSHAAINTASGAVALTKNNGSGLFNVPYYASGSVMSVTIAPLIFGHWNQLSFSVTNTGSTAVKIQVYKADGVTLVSDTDLPGNSTGFTTSPVDLSTIPYSSTIGLIKLKATLTTSNTNYTPRLNDWTVTWVTRNGVVTDPRPAISPWPTTYHDNRSTNQMDGILAPAYTPMWANNTVGGAGHPVDVEGPRPGLITGSGDLVTVAPPATVVWLDPLTGHIKMSLTLDTSVQSVGPLNLQAVARDGTIYLTRSSLAGDDYSSVVQMIAVRNGQLLWSRYVDGGNGYGYGDALQLDNSGAITLRSPHGYVSKYSSTGAKLWQAFNNYWNTGNVQSIGLRNTIYSHVSGGQTTVISTTGAILSTSAQAAYGSPIVDQDGSVYLMTSGGTCTAGSSTVTKFTATGGVVWSTTSTTPFLAWSGPRAMDDAYIYSIGVCNDNVAIFSKADGTLLKTLTYGTPRPSYHWPVEFYQSLNVDHAHQLLFTRSSYISYTAPENSVLLQRFDGTVSWHYSMPAEPSFKPIGSSSQFYVSWGTGTLAFKPWTLSASAPSSVAAGSNLAITATSSMLAADPVTSEANKIEAVMQDGQKVSLAYVSTDSGGITHWSGQYTPSASDPGGVYIGTIEAGNARVQTGTGTSFATPAAGTSNTGLKLTFGYTVQAITSTVISSSQSTDGQTLILSATVSPATAAGTISFYDGSVNLGSAAIANGTASFDLPAFPLTVGTHSFTASYGGSSTYAPSTSAAISPTITLTSGTTATGGGGGGGGGRRSPTVTTTSFSASSQSTSSLPASAQPSSRPPSAGSSAAAAPAARPAPLAVTSSVTPDTRLTTVNVFMRAKPTKQSASLALLAPGSAVSLISKTTDWAEVKTADGKTGFILRKYLQTVPSSQPAPSPVAPSSQSRTTTMPLNLRAATTKQSKSKAQIPKGTPVTLLQVLIDWAKVQAPDGKTGYVLRKYLRK